MWAAVEFSAAEYLGEIIPVGEHPLGFFADQQAAIRAVDREMGGGGGEIYSEPGHMASDFTGIEYRVLRVQDPNRTSPPVFAKDVGDDPHGRQLGCLFVGMDDNDYKAVKNAADEWEWERQPGPQCTFHAIRDRNERLLEAADRGDIKKLQVCHARLGTACGRCE